MLESLNYSFRNPKKHNLSYLPHQTVEKLQKKNHGVLRGPQLGKQRWRPRLGILRVNVWKHLPLQITKTHASGFPCPSNHNASTAVDPLHLPTLSTGAVSLLPLLCRPPFRVLPPWHPVCPAMHTTLCQHWRPQTSGVVSWASGCLAIQGDDKK